MRTKVLASAAGAVGLFVLGAVVAVSGAAVALVTLRALGVTWPIGLIFVLLVTGLSFHLGRLLLARRGVLAIVLGWVLGVAILHWPRPEGDILVPGTWSGVVFLAGGVVLGVWTLARAILRHEADREEDDRYAGVRT